MRESFRKCKANSSDIISQLFAVSTYLVLEIFKKKLRIAGFVVTSSYLNLEFNNYVFKNAYYSNDRNTGFVLIFLFQ